MERGAGNKDRSIIGVPLIFISGHREIGKRTRRGTHRGRTFRNIDMAHGSARGV